MIHLCYSTQCVQNTPLRVYICKTKGQRRVSLLLTCCRTFWEKSSCSFEISITFPSICLTSSTIVMTCSNSCSFSWANWTQHHHHQVHTGEREGEREREGETDKTYRWRKNERGERGEQLKSWENGKGNQKQRLREWKCKQCYCAKTTNQLVVLKKPWNQPRQDHVTRKIKQ